MISGLTDTLNFNGQALQLRAERQRVIASNIANADTPGYQARDFDFAAALKDATGSAGVGSGIASQVMGGADGSSASPALRYAVPSQTSLDSNTVDMDRERSASIENAFKYEATLRFINEDVRNLTSAMKSFSGS